MQLMAIYRSAPLIAAWLLTTLFAQIARGSQGPNLKLPLAHTDNPKLPPKILDFDGDSSISNPPSGVHLVRLHKRASREQNAQSGSGKSFYVARLAAGHPDAQDLLVTFDTASGQVILPFSGCTSMACLEHRRYKPEGSAVSADINADGDLVVQGKRLADDSVTRDAITIGFSSLDLGDGKVAGHFVEEAICLKATSPEGSLVVAQESNVSVDSQGRHSLCAKVSMVMATEMSDVPFRAVPHDAYIGLGLKGLSIRSRFTFLERLGQTKDMDASWRALAGPAPPLTPLGSTQFGLFFSQSFGEIAFGGHDPKRLASPLTWVPVENVEQGYWQVAIQGIRVGNRTLEACKGGTCRGIIDSCTSTIGVPKALASDLKGSLDLSSGALPGLDCAGPDLQLELQGATLTLRAEDYATSDGIKPCEPSISTLDLPEQFAGVFILGEPLLRRYYSVFDWGTEKIGFGVAAVPSQEELLKHSAVEEAERTRDLEEEAVLLKTAAEAALAAREAAASEKELEQEQVFILLMQALAVRVAVVMMVVFAGTHFIPVKSFFAHLDELMASRGLLAEASMFAPLVPLEESPAGDECVICLGSCEDECNRAAAAATCQDCSDVKRPRWRRLQCGHHFHEQCIMEWLKKAKHCPYCRRHLRDTSPTGWLAQKPAPPATAFSASAIPQL
mmetsp:Transcript_106021/g.192915  ORF Transcript_106021/g.192915 Transcript_106021/m.192915 type:complete len:674 (-) Transcript_106021:52-2073(-)